jgi:hypothetical protein
MAGSLAEIGSRRVDRGRVKLESYVKAATILSFTATGWARPSSVSGCKFPRGRRSDLATH